MDLMHASATQSTRKFPVHRLTNSPPYDLHTHSANIIMEAFLALAYWSYVPLYFLPFAIGGCLLKVPIEVRHRHSYSCRGELMKRVHDSGRDYSQGP